MRTLLKVGDQIKILKWSGISDDFTLRKIYTICSRNGSLGFRDDIGEFRHASCIIQYENANQQKPKVKQFGIVKWTEKYYK